MQSLIREYGPMRPFQADAERLVALTAKDKKNRSGARSFILPTGIGSVTIVRDVSERELLDAATAIADEARGLERDRSGAPR
jgi:3-dehydroquinate synthase